MAVSKTRKIKRVIKIAVATAIIFIAVILAFFVQHTHTFENSHMKKWLKITDTERIATIERIVKESENQELIIACVTKISELPDSNEMIIRDAISLCYNGIKLNRTVKQED